jgi:hypothetical protein
MSGAPSDETSGLPFVLVTWTALVQFSKFVAGPRQHYIYLSVFITSGEMVAQLYIQALGNSGTSGVLFPVPTIVGPWGYSFRDKSRGEYVTDMGKGGQQLEPRANQWERCKKVRSRGPETAACVTGRD